MYRYVVEPDPCSDQILEEIHPEIRESLSDETLVLMVSQERYCQCCGSWYLRDHVGGFIEDPYSESGWLALGVWSRDELPDHVAEYFGEEIR